MASVVEVATAATACVAVCVQESINSVLLFSIVLLLCSLSE